MHCPDTDELGVQFHDDFVRGGGQLREVEQALSSFDVADERGRLVAEALAQAAQAECGHGHGGGGFALGKTIGPEVLAHVQVQGAIFRSGSSVDDIGHHAIERVVGL